MRDIDERPLGWPNEASAVKHCVFLNTVHDARAKEQEAFGKEIDQRNAEQKEFMPVNLQDNFVTEREKKIMENQRPKERMPQLSPRM